MTRARAGQVVRAGAAAVALATAGLALDALANPSGPAPSASASPADEPPGPSCVEQLPDGVKRPQMDEHFPSRGVSGYATPLTLTIRHGKGESVLVDGLRIVKQGDAAKALSTAGFAIPEPDGGAGPVAKTHDNTATTATTELVISVVPLAPKAGQNVMTLPPLPVTLTRAGGELMTLCTRSHTIRVDEPIAGERDPKVHKNPPARPQKEEWVLLEEVLVGVGAAAVVVALTLLAARWWRRRPRPEKPVVRPIPWLVALAELDGIRSSPLLAEHKNDEHFDRVSDTIRRYLGARYQFDTLDAGWSGIETTTDEMKALLRRIRPPVSRFGEICAFLDEADLVKFARVFPDDADCNESLRRAEAIVRGTIPANVSGVAPGGPAGDGGVARPPAAEGGRA